MKGKLASLTFNEAGFSTKPGAQIVPLAGSNACARFKRG